MNCSRTCIVGGLLLLMLPGAARAIWTSDSDSGARTPEARGIIVKFATGVTPSAAPSKQPAGTGIDAVDALSIAYGVTSHRKLLKTSTATEVSAELRRIYVFGLPEQADFETIAAEYAALPMVEYAHPDWIVELHDAPDDPLYPHQWALNNTGQGYYHVERIEGDFNDTLAIVLGTPDADIDAGEVFDSPPDATHAVVVAIVDTGVDWDHPDLAGMMWGNPDEIPANGLDDDHNGYVDDIVGWDFCVSLFSTEEDNDPTDEMGHGTHCAGIVAATINNAVGVTGTVPQARIMAIKCHPTLSISNLIRGVFYAAENGADVISMSWGTWFQMPSLEEAMAFARTRGAILVASAGNDGAEAWNYPASYPQTICVSASNSDDRITEWSTYSEWVDVCAPGQSILSLRAAGTDMYGDHDEPYVHIIEEEYYLASGTSMSAPYVAAVAAYLRSVSPGIPHDSAQAVIESTADDILDPYGQGDTLPGWDTYSGHGRVNLQNMLAAAPGLRAIIDSPRPRTVVSGIVEVTGTANGTQFSGYSLTYGSGFDPESWTNIVTSSEPVTEGVLGSWNAAGLEGVYTVRLQVSGHEARVRLHVADSNIVEITSPQPGDTVAGFVPLIGSLIGPDVSFAILDYGEGSAPAEWTVVDTISRIVYQDLLYEWDANDLTPSVWHTLRMTAWADTGVIGVESIYVFHESMFAGDNGWTAYPGGKLAKTANYGDFNADGQFEIVIGTEEGVFFYTPEGTPQTAGMPVFPLGNWTIPLAVGNLDGDGIDDLVGVSDSGIIWGFSSSGNWFQTPLPEKPAMFFVSYQLNGPTLFLKDIDGDGLDEIHFAYTSWSGLDTSVYHIFRSDGIEWGSGFPLPAEYKHCFPADLDGDKVCEIYCYNTTTFYLYQFDTAGVVLDSLLLELDGAVLITTIAQLSAVDLNGDNIHELVVAGAFLKDAIWSEQYIWAFENGLNIVAGWPHTFGEPAWIGPTPTGVAFADLNGDATLEYYLAYNYSDCSIRAWNLDGTSFIGGGTQGFFVDGLGTTQLFTPVVGDLTGDGYPEILLGQSNGFEASYVWERLLAYDRFAELLPNYPVLVGRDYQLMENSNGGVPLLADINQDGYIDITYPWRDYLLFTDLDGVGYNEQVAFQRMRRYNRRLNNTARLASEIVTFCGDINADGHGPNIADLTFLVAYLFGNGAAPPNMDNADINGHDGAVNIIDLSYLVAYLFDEGAAPDCGPKVSH